MSEEIVENKEQLATKKPRRKKSESKEKTKAPRKKNSLIKNLVSEILSEQENSVKEKKPRKKYERKKPVLEEKKKYLNIYMSQKEKTFFHEIAKSYGHSTSGLVKILMLNFVKNPDPTLKVGGKGTKYNKVTRLAPEI
jgi:hypothetical protein